jgi:hypothetical protein
MKRILVLSILAVAVLGGVASADRGRHRGHWKHHRGDGWSGGVVVRPTVRVEPRRVFVQRTRVVRRPIFVQRPAITARYYDYDRRPRVLAENYAAMPGYYWVNGTWYWNGAEWIWQVGHYEPDPSYVEPQYNYGADYDPGCDHAAQYEGSYGY